MTTATDDSVDPDRSQAIGITVGLITTLVVGVGIYLVLDYFWDFWYFGEIFGVVLGIVIGGFAGAAIYALRLRTVDLNWVGVGRRFKHPTKKRYRPGLHWASPIHDIVSVPGPDLKFLVSMPGEQIDAQDGVTVYLGTNDDRPNEAQYSVVDEIRYIATDNPEEQLQEAYLEEARVFYGQAGKAIGVKAEKALFSDFLMLPPRTTPEPPEYAEFRERLAGVRFKLTGTDEEGGTPEEPRELFGDSAVETIMRKAGNFRTKAATWGLGNLVAFTPDVRENPAAEKAAAEKQAARERMKALDIHVNKITSLSAKMRKDTGASPDLAATLVAGIDGMKVDIRNETFNIGGLADVARELGVKAIDAFAPKRASRKPKPKPQEGGANAG